MVFNLIKIKIKINGVQWRFIWDANEYAIKCIWNTPEMQWRQNNLCNGDSVKMQWERTEMQLRWIEDAIQIQHNDDAIRCNGGGMEKQRIYNLALIRN